MGQRGPYIIQVHSGALGIAIHEILPLSQALQLGLVLALDQLEDWLRVDGQLRQLAQDVGGRRHAEDGWHGP